MENNTVLPSSANPRTCSQNPRRASTSRATDGSSRNSRSGSPDAALRVGARGYLLKDVTLEQLVDTIHVLAAGGTLFQPTVTAKLLERLADHPLTFDRVALPEPLTPRELEILRLLAGGYSNREIAGATHVAEGTVKNHVSNVLWKLGVRDRTRAVLRGLELGLIPGVLRPRPGRPGGA